MRARSLKAALLAFCSVVLVGGIGLPDSLVTPASAAVQCGYARATGSKTVCPGSTVYLRSSPEGGALETLVGGDTFVITDRRDGKYVYGYAERPRKRVWGYVRNGYWLGGHSTP